MRADAPLLRMAEEIAAGAVMLTLVACAGDAGQDPAPYQSVGPPNVVFIMTDDIGYGDIGSYGAPDIATPNLDRLAAEGTRFTDFYANAPVCTPTRVGFLTGRYQQRLGLEGPLPNASETEDGNLSANGRGLAADGRTLPQLLENAG
jgi:arylsulfatase A